MLGLSQQYKCNKKQNSPSVVSWAVSFEKLLEDTLGLRTFTEFLKREFSAENIMFWRACEQYRHLSDKHFRAKLGKEIFDRHLRHGAAEPINIDSHAHQVALDGVQDAPPELFDLAQKQIFNLMKFDCYQRFLNSELFTESLLAEKLGKPYPCQEPGSKSPRRFRGRSKSRDRNRLFQSVKIQNQEKIVTQSKNNEGENAADKEDIDEKKRKSLLPWQKAKNKNNEQRRCNSKSPVLGERNSSLRRSEKRRNRSKYRGFLDRETDTSTEIDSSDIALELPNDSLTSDEVLTSSELSSLASLKDTDDCYLFRVTLPNGLTTVLRTLEGETVGSIVRKLMEKHALASMTVDILLEENNQAVDLKTPLANLKCKAIRVEQRTILRLELPSKKVIAVKAIPTRRCDEVLIPVLRKYGIDLKDVNLLFVNSQKILNFDDPINAADGQKICVKLINGTPVKSYSLSSYAVDFKQSRKHRKDMNSNLFEDAVNGRSVFWYDELGVLDLDEAQGMKTQLSIPDGETSFCLDVTRRNSFTVNKENKSKSRSMYANRASIHEGMGIKIQLSDQLPIQQNENKSERSSNKCVRYRDSCADLTAVWSKAQRQLDDQRGTEINCELPDFLRPRSDSAPERTPESDL